MPSLRKKSRAVPFTVGDVANAAKSNPYLNRLINDPKLRKNVRTAVNSGKSAYKRVSNGKVPARALLEDKRFHADVARALGAARDATITLSRIQRKRARRGLTAGRALVIAGIGGGAALVGSEKLRSKVLDLLFGKEEEFQYTPPSNSGSAETPSSTVGAA
jgi:hypothetical protein